jgi:hypothetical protein
MKILCAKSGLYFKCEHFPYNLDNASISHPAFSLPQKKLLGLTTKWANGEFTPVDSYLLFLSLLSSTGQVEFRSPCKYTIDTDQVVANNMEDLIRIVGQLNMIHHPHFSITQIAITKENNTLSNAHYWIENWISNIQDFKDGYAEFNAQKDLQRREAALEKLIKSSYKELILATHIANWAELAGAFPTFTVNCPFGTMPIAEYWKLIIRKCINTESIFSVPTADIQELIEHCEDQIPHGTIYAHTLMQMLRNGKEKQVNFLGLGEWDSSSSSLSYVLMQSDDSVEKANLQLLIQTAPQAEPKLTDYPTRFEWLKASTKYKIAQSLSSTGTGTGIENL